MIKAQGSGLRAQGSGLRAQGSGLRAQGNAQFEDVAMNGQDPKGVDRREFFKTASAGITAAGLMMTPRERAMAQALDEKGRFDRIAGCSYPIRYIFKNRAGGGRGAGAAGGAGGAGAGGGGGGRPARGPDQPRAGGAAAAPAAPAPAATAPAQPQ